MGRLARSCKAQAPGYSVNLVIAEFAKYFVRPGGKIETPLTDNGIEHGQWETTSLRLGLTYMNLAEISGLLMEISNMKINKTKTPIIKLILEGDQTASVLLEKKDRLRCFVGISDTWREYERGLFPNRS